MRPIYDTLAGKPMTLKWSDELDEAFTTAKEALAQATMLVHPHDDKPTALKVDASRTAVGEVLEQNRDGSDWKPVAFFSRKLRPAEQNYSAFDRAPSRVSGYSTLPLLSGRAFFHAFHRPQTVDFRDFQNQRSVVPETTATPGLRLGVHNRRAPH